MLTTDLLKSLHQSLLRAFPAEEFQTLMESRLGLRLNLLVSPTADMQTKVFEVVQTAERAGWTSDLVRAAFEARPDDEALAQLYENLGLAPQVMVYDGGKPAHQAEEYSSPFEVDDPSSVGSPDFRESAGFRQWLAAIEARVCRVEVSGSHSTGFLVGPSVVLTCCHVLGKSSRRKPPRPLAVRCRFDYRRTPDGVVSEGAVEPLATDDWLVDYSPVSDLDYALILLKNRVGAEPSVNDGLTIPPRGWFSFPQETPVIVAGAPLLIAQYALYGPLKVVMDMRAMVSVAEDGARIQYTAKTEPGAAGAPCFNTDWELVAMHQSRKSGGPDDGPRSQKSDLGEGIAITAIRDALKRKGKASFLDGETIHRELSPVTEPSPDPNPPDPGPVVDEDDPQKNRWGGIPERDGRRATVELVETFSRTFLFNAVVESTDGTPLDGPVIFHLHDTFPRSVIHIRKIREGRRAVFEEVTAYGVFTIGVQVKNRRGEWIGLEFDLAQLTELPARFRER
jgi:Trypsin-like peptidase domain/Effector-associated domain 1